MRTSRGRGHVAAGRLRGAGYSGSFKGMSTLAEIEAAVEQLQRGEKLRLMELLWGGLSRAEAEVDSPAWHEEALAETARRLAEGREEVLDWSQTKAELRGRTA